MATSAKPKPRELTAAEIETITTILRARLANWASQQGGPVNYQFDDLTDVAQDLSDEMPPMIVIVFNVPEPERGKIKHVLNPF